MKNIPVVNLKCEGVVNYPYIVERKNTENWNPSAGLKTLSEAEQSAAEYAVMYPSIPWRIAHYTSKDKK